MDAGLVLRRLRADEVAAAHALEAVSYPEDEAASLEGMTFRQAEAGDFFFGLFDTNAEGDGGEAAGALVGFVNGTCCVEEELHHPTMSKHVPAGATLCIHSVVIQSDRRRRGLATAMLTEYVQRVLAACPAVARVRLIAKAHNLGLYQRCGFSILRLSPVVHGKDAWFEMGLDRLSVLCSKRRPFVQVDAFTDKPFGGNPAAVVFCEGGETAEWMQSWAGEINLSETAFLTKDSITEGEEGEHVYALRWFTPAVEVDLCGHATLAAAHALWTTGRVPSQAAIAFQTKSGQLLARRRTAARNGDDDADGAATAAMTIWLDFPAEPASPVAMGPGSDEWRRVYDAFACEDPSDIVFVGRNRVDLLVVLTHAAFHRLGDAAASSTVAAKLEAIECRGVIATCRAAPGAGTACSDSSGNGVAGFDFWSRFFAPRCGISEDPVTGSAHCCLAPYWAAVLDKTSLRAYQASKRGGELCVELDDARGRVHLGGRAVLVQHGFLGC